MKKVTLFTTILCLALVQITNAQITNEVIQNNSSNTLYNHFIRTGSGAAVYVNQVDNTQPILKLSSGTAEPNAGVKFLVENNGGIKIGETNSIKIDGYSGIETSGGAHWLHLNRYRNNNVAIGLNSTANVYMVKGGGKVGIGTTSPLRKLHVVNSEGKMRLQSTDASKWTEYEAINGNGKNSIFGMSPGENGYAHIGTHGANDFKIRVNNQIKATFKTDGRVGIGIESPNYKLDVNGSLNTSSDLYARGIKIRGGVDAVIKRDTPGNLMLVSGGGGSSIYMNYAYGSGSGGVKIFDGGTTNYTNLKVNSNGDFSITPKSGKVGIGTTNPNSKLHSTGGALLHNVAIGDDPFGNLQWAYESIQLPSNNNLRVNFGSAERFIFTNTGKLGIGTSNPQNKLSVNGTIWAKEVKVQLTDAADYVFEKDYDLRSLEEVESFIKENKHLPEIPSAQDFKKNDMKVSEMTNKLLQKIEELTLYTIEQEKIIKNQESRVKNQEEEMKLIKAQLQQLLNATK